MAGHKKPGPQGQADNLFEIDDGTMCRAPTPPPIVVGAPMCVATPIVWNYDPNKLLAEPALNSNFVNAAKTALDAAAAAGLMPKVHEAYRSPGRSDELYKKWQDGKGGRAAPGWASCHNYGLAMDVYLYDAKGKVIDNHVKGWYKEFKKLAKFFTSNGFVWGANFGSGDSDHFEYHPNWPDGAGGDFLNKVRAWAMKLAAAENEKAKQSTNIWLEFFWWAAGAGGKSPPSGTESPPKQ